LDEELKTCLDGMARRINPRFDERLHETETRLLRGLADYHRGTDGLRLETGQE
jgi:hypothetical protein